MCPFQTWPPLWLNAHMQQRAHTRMHAHAKTLSTAKNRKLNGVYALKTAFPRSSMDLTLPYPLRSPHYSRTETWNKAHWKMHWLTAKDSCSLSLALPFPSPTARHTHTRSLRDRASTWGREGEKERWRKIGGRGEAAMKGLCFTFLWWLSQASPP